MLGSMLAALFRYLDASMRRRRWLSGCALGACAAWMQLSAGALRAATTEAPAAAEEQPTRFLPLFPLGIVAFPDELVFLHVFEPRYRQLITECVETGMGFGIVTVVPGGASSIGTEMRLENVLRTRESGSMDVAVRGLRTFTLKRFERNVEGKLYSGGQVVFHRNDPRVEPAVQSALVDMYNRLQSAIGATRALTDPLPENLSFVIGHEVGLSKAQELQLLTMSAEHDRQAYLLRHLIGAQ
ncbi:MAG: LON peptidase substrate-binding domain-containing protein [Gammaproteobacteria bacterium]|nr:LON peptidase substrate-binding domain-containing protein [Gammaproteobacteria bacterium]